jgi:hypothetical protein
VRTTRVWRRVLGVEYTVIEWVDLEPDGRGGQVLVAQVRPKAGVARRCSRCGRRCAGYDSSAKPRRWRGLDLGAMRVFLQATTQRVSCPEHGVVVAAVPWARPGSRFTAAFEDTCAWLVCHATLSVVAVLLRVAWRSVSDIVARVVAARSQAGDRLAGLRRIGIDEISYRKGQRYLLVVTDHDTGRLVGAGKDRTGRDPAPVLRRARTGPGGGADPCQRRWRRVHRASAQALTEAFLWVAQRTVTKTATVSLHGNTYQVGAALAGRKVELVFSPFNLEVIEVRHGDRSYGHAVPFRITRHAHPKARPETPEPAPAPATGIAYLHLVADAHHHQVAADDRIGFDALYSHTEHNPEPSPEQPSLTERTDDEQPRQACGVPKVGHLR